MTVGQLETEMSSDELTYWMMFMKIEKEEFDAKTKPSTS